MLPHTITYLVFGHSFNKSVFDLPNSIEYISFGNKFNQPLDSSPNSIYYINIDSTEIYNYNGTEFNQHTYKLPSKLTNVLVYLKKKNIRLKITLFWN